MYCRNCGTIIADGTEKCPSCGHSAYNSDNYCPQCGNICIPGDKLCFQCGADLTSTKPPLETQIQVETKEQYDTKTGPKFLSDDKKYCRNCGLVISSDHTRCEFCGEENGGKYCQKCGSGTTVSDTVCSVCSSPLTLARNVGYIPQPPPIHYQQKSNRNFNNNNYNNNYNNYRNMNNYDYNRSCDWTTTLLLSFLGFLGIFGIHRFYTGHIVIGIIQLLTAGGCGVWWIIDLVMILVGSYRDSKGRPLEKK